jgi:hypothetical protein
MKRKCKIGQRVKVILSDKDARKYASPLLCIEDMLSSPGFTQEMFETIGKTGIVVERIEGFPRVKFETGDEWNYLDAWLEPLHPKVKVGGVYEMANGERVVIVANKAKHKILPKRKLMLIGVEIGTDNILFFDKTGKSLLKKNHIVKRVDA